MTLRYQLTCLQYMCHDLHERFQPILLCSQWKEVVASNWRAPLRTRTGMNSQARVGVVRARVAGGVWRAPQCMDGDGRSAALGPPTQLAEPAQPTQASMPTEKQGKTQNYKYLLM